MPIKKAELHTHLEGTCPPWLANEIAVRNQLPFPAELLSPDGSGYVYSDFFDFLKAYDKVANLIKTPLDYYDITFDYLKARAFEDTIYVEMMYSPDHAESATNIPSIEHLTAIQQAINDAEKQYGIIGKIIITAVRHFGAIAAVRIAAQAVKHNLPCVVGFGLGGDEINYGPKLFTEAYKIAADNGLYCTVHAGEFSPASSIIEAIDHLPVKRIGHGINAIACKETIQRLLDTNIALEICPSSNLCLGLVKNLSSHPLNDFLKAGISVSLGSDDPPFFNTTLGKEYEKVQQNFGYNDKEMTKFTENAIDAAFADKDTKAKLKQKLYS